MSAPSEIPVVETSPTPMVETQPTSGEILLVPTEGEVLPVPAPAERAEILSRSSSCSTRRWTLCVLSGRR
jgi:hypothetical protein